MDLMINMFCDLAAPMWQHSEKLPERTFSSFGGDRKKHKETQKEVNKEMSR
jgi:hypothetical protein